MHKTKSLGNCKQKLRRMDLLREMRCLDNLQVNAQECEADWAPCTQHGLSQLVEEKCDSATSSQERKHLDSGIVGQSEFQLKLSTLKTSPRMCSTHLLVQKGTESWRDYL